MSQTCRIHVSPPFLIKPNCGKADDSALDPSNIETQAQDMAADEILSLPSPY
jgi:hypothetical protein